MKEHKNIRAYLEIDDKIVYFDVKIPMDEFDDIEDDKELQDFLADWITEEVDQRMSYGWNEVKLTDVKTIH